MIFIDYLALIGGLTISLCLIPQIYKIYETKHVDNISYTWQIMYIVGMICHLMYSFHYKLLPLIIPGSLELFMLLILTFMKYYYSNKKEKNINFKNNIQNNIENNIDNNSINSVSILKVSQV